MFSRHGWIAAVAAGLAFVTAADGGSAWAQSNAYQIGYDYYKNKQYTACAESMEKAVQEDPDDYDRLFLLATCWSRAGNWAKALEPLKKATLIKDDAPAAFRLLAHAYLKASRPDYYQAKVALERAVKLEPKDFNSWYLLGATSLKLKEYDDAISAFKSALKLKPSDGRSNRDLGLAYLKSRDYAQAETYLAKAAAAKPSDCRLAEYLAMAQLNNRGDERYAEKAFKTIKSCADKPKATTNALYIAGRTALFTGDAATSETYLARVVAKDPSNYSALNYYGQALELQEKHKEALEAYKKALDAAKAAKVKGEALSDFFYRYAHALHLLGRYKEALPFYDQTLALNPKHERALHWKKKAVERIERQKLEE